MDPWFPLLAYMSAFAPDLYLACQP